MAMKWQYKNSVLHSEHFDTKYSYVWYWGTVEINKIMSLTHTKCSKIAPWANLKTDIAPCMPDTRMTDGMYMETNRLNIVGSILYAFRMTENIWQTMCTWKASLTGDIFLLWGFVLKNQTEYKAWFMLYHLCGTGHLM